MAKYVVFSFDDGRLDTYTNAFAILKKYGFPATVNITTDFINNPQNYTNFRSAGNLAMTWEQIADLQNNGWEIASHGHTHLNDCEDIKKSLDEFAKHQVDIENIGFASPNSEINGNNFSGLKEGLDNAVSYVRSGLQIRREGLLYAGVTFLNRRLKSKRVFCLLNQRCKLNALQDLTQKPMLSVGISSDMTEKSIVSLLETLSDNECYILMFHSIVSDKENAWKVDSWWWDERKFERLCNWLASQKDIKVITTQQLVKFTMQKQ